MKERYIEYNGYRLKASRVDAIATSILARMHTQAHNWDETKADMMAHLPVAMNSARRSSNRKKVDFSDNDLYNYVASAFQSAIHKSFSKNHVVTKPYNKKIDLKCVPELEQDFADVLTFTRMQATTGLTQKILSWSTPKESRVAKYIFVDDLTYAEVGEIYGVTYQAVAHWVNKWKAKIRKRLLLDQKSGQEKSKMQ